MARHYGIPYMGSKQKLVDKIIPFILKRHPDTTDLYDLFGGGSVALYAVRKYPNMDVHYNELSKSIGGLMQHLKDGGDIPFNFVKRSEFDLKHRGDDWYAGLLQSCWSFGNSGKSYMYGADIQDLKEEVSKLAMTGTADMAFIEETCEQLVLTKTGAKVKCKIYLNPKRYKTPYQRRIVLARQIPNFGALQHLARLERLVQIEHMQGIKRLNITVGKSYDEVAIKGTRPLLYCDPPYENTAEYLEGGFDHKAFYEWCATRPFPVYISSYKVSDDRFKLVKAVNTRSLLASASSSEAKYNYENVYWNGVN